MFYFILIVFYSVPFYVSVQSYKVSSLINLKWKYMRPSSVFHAYKKSIGWPFAFNKLIISKEGCY